MEKVYYTVYSETCDRLSSDYGIRRFEGSFPSLIEAENEVKAIQRNGDGAYYVRE